MQFCSFFSRCYTEENSYEQREREAEQNHIYFCYEIHIYQFTDQSTRSYTKDNPYYTAHSA